MVVAVDTSGIVLCFRLLDNKCYRQEILPHTPLPNAVRQWRFPHSTHHSLGDPHQENRNRMKAQLVLS